MAISGSGWPSSILPDQGLRGSGSPILQHFSVFHGFFSLFRHPPSPSPALCHRAQKAFPNRWSDRALRPNSTVQKPLSKRCQMARNPLPQTSAGWSRRVLSGALEHMRGFRHLITVIGCALPGAVRKPSFATLTCFIMVHHAFRYRAGGPVGM